MNISSNNNKQTKNYQTEKARGLGRKKTREEIGQPLDSNPRPPFGWSLRAVIFCRVMGQKEKKKRKKKGCGGGGGSRYESTIYQWDLQASEAVAYSPSFVPSYVSGLRITCMLLTACHSAKSIGIFMARLKQRPLTHLQPHTHHPHPTPQHHQHHHHHHHRASPSCPLCSPLSLLFSFHNKSDREACKPAGRRTWNVGVGKRGTAQLLESLTCDRKVPGSSPGRSGGRIAFSRVNFLCWLLFRYPSHPRVNAVARKRSRPFCQRCR